MKETIEKPNPRMERLLKRIHAETMEEYETEISFLHNRSDYRPCFDYFLDLLIRPLAPEKMQATIGKPTVEHLCNQAPYELFHAYGVHPLKMSSGCFSVQRLSASGYPVLMCPMLRSTIGMTELYSHSITSSPPSVVPTTCDWVVKLPEMMNRDPHDVHILELPHVRQGEKAQNRWLEEVYGLIAFLERLTGKRLKRASLLDSIHTFTRAWQAFFQLIELKRKSSISGLWFMVVANTFMLDSIEPWTRSVRKLVEDLGPQTTKKTNKAVFLAGSPIIFPNFKLLRVIEDAGMNACADDMCSSERVLPGPVQFDDPSLHGLIRALAERYHRGCACPTFADNDRRVNNILHTCSQYHIRHVLYHVLKGCHPCDMESFIIDNKLVQKGLKWLRIETDYTKEDSRNILARLEAFSEL